MTMPQSQQEPRLTANDGPTRPAVIPDVHLISLVDLLAEAFVVKLAAANDNNAPIRE
jgi:hypothetical protein